MTTPVINEAIVFPTGVDPNNADAYYELGNFMIYVRWQGHHGYVVERTRDERLSVKGRKWCYHVEKRNRRFYYFPTFGEALQAAKEVVDDVLVNGKTWKEWQEWKS